MNGVWTLLASSSIDLPLEGGLLALNPAAAYRLGREGRAYQIPEDYYREAELRADEDAYFQRQRAWFEQLDAFIQQGCGGGPEFARLGSIHYNRIKYLVDSVIIRARVLEFFLNREKPARIVLAEEAWEAGEEISFYDFNHPLRYSLRPLLEAACRRHGFQFQILTPSKQKPAAAAPASGGWKKRLQGLGLKALAEKIRYETWRSFEKKAGRSYLFLDAGTYAIDSQIRRAMRRGRVFLKQGEILRDLRTGRRLALAEEKPAGPETMQPLFEAFCRGPLFAELETAAPGAGEAFLPYFRHFFKSLAPEAASQTQAYEAFLRREKITAVIARAAVGENYAAPLLAAERLGIPRVCFQHAICAMEMKDWIVDELAFFDLSFAMHPLSRSYFKDHQAGIGAACRVESASSGLRQIQDKSGRRKQAPRRPRLFYVPAKLARGTSHFNTPFYPMPWYFEHQKKILEGLAARPDVDVVYKHSRYQTWVEESVLPWLREKAWPNVRIVEGPFPEFLGQADRVIFDYPTSGIFECAAAGVPFLGLYHESVRIWEPALRFFGPSLAVFRDSAEAVEKAGAFLDQDAERFRVALPWEDEANPFDLIDGRA